MMTQREYTLSSREIEDALIESGYLAWRELPDGRVLALQKMLFTTGLCCDCDEWNYRGRFCYRSTPEALVAMYAWDGVGDPPGNWIVSKGLGRPDRQGPGSTEV